MDPLEIALLTGVGLVSGVINTLAGGGSLLSVPLLVFVGLPGDIANGTNRIGVLMQSATASWRFRAEGVPGMRGALPLLIPICLGSILGAALISRLPAEAFERVFGVVMLVLLVPLLRGQPSPPSEADDAGPRWSPVLHYGVFFLIGVFGGAIQAGVGLLVIMALSRSGLDLVSSNSIKVVLVGVLTAAAVPVFIAADQVAWGPALFLMIGFSLGGAAGARLAVLGGEKLIRPVLAAALVALAGRMLSLY